MSEITQRKVTLTRAEKREAVRNDKNSMTMDSKIVRKVKIEPIIRSSYKMTAQLITSNSSNADNCKTHIK